MSLIDTLKADAAAADTFLMAEGAKVLGWVESAEKPVADYFADLITDAKAKAVPLVDATAGSLSTRLSALESDFETAIANALQLALGGSPAAALISELSTEGLDSLVKGAEALVQPLFVKVIAALAPTPAAPLQPS